MVPAPWPQAAVDLNKIPDEYVICASYDAELGELQKLKVGRCRLTPG